MLKNLHPSGKKISILAVPCNKYMFGLSSFHGVNTEAKAILIFHVLSVSRHNVPNCPNSVVNTKEQSICPEIIMTELSHH